MFSCDQERGSVLEPESNEGGNVKQRNHEIQKRAYEDDDNSFISRLQFMANQLEMENPTEYRDTFPQYDLGKSGYAVHDFEKNSVIRNSIWFNGSIYPPIYIPKFGDICISDDHCNENSWCQNYRCECFEGYFRFSENYACFSKGTIMQFCFYFSLCIFIVFIMLAIPMMTAKGAFTKRIVSAKPPPKGFGYAI
ncbi:unnamed protein product [Gordionus sp. m RMFG-2023]